MGEIVLGTQHTEFLIFYHHVQTTDSSLLKGIPWQLSKEMLQQCGCDQDHRNNRKRFREKCDNTERIFKENKSVNSGAVHLKRSKAFQKSECGSQLATGFHKMDPHNIPKMPVGIPTTEKHVPKSKEAE